MPFVRVDIAGTVSDIAAATPSLPASLQAVAFNLILDIQIPLTGTLATITSDATKQLQTAHFVLSGTLTANTIVDFQALKTALVAFKAANPKLTVSLTYVETG